MRASFIDLVERGRIRTGKYASQPNDPYGAFDLISPLSRLELYIFASDGKDPIAEGWEHVSVSNKRRTPNWTDMCWIKDLFWDEKETVTQFHPPKSEYVNLHPYCLHLWRHRNLIRPPSHLVGPREVND
jgi:hypothetical protein